MKIEERIEAAIHCEEPDRVPICPRIWRLLLNLPGYKCQCWKHQLKAGIEFGYDPLIFYPSARVDNIRNPYATFTDSDYHLRVKLRITQFQDFDMIVREMKTPAGVLTEKRRQLKPGKRYGFTPDSVETVDEHLIKGTGDLEKIPFILPKPEKAVNLHDFYEAMETVSGKGIMMITDYMDYSLAYACGMRELMIKYLRERKFVYELVTILQEHALETLRLYLEAGAKHIFTSGFAWGVGAGWSPKMFSEIFAPLIKERTALLKSYGAVHHYYDDGTVMPILKQLEDCGIQVLSTLAPPPFADNSLAKAKKEVGNEMCLWGNIDLWNVIRNGTPELITTTARKAIEDAGYSGGYILGSSDGLTEDTPNANLMAFIAAGKKYGGY